MKITAHRMPLCRPWVVWLAVLIALLGANSSIVTHALIRAGGQSPQGVEICTSEGPRWVTAEEAESSEESNPVPDSFASTARCQFCLQPTDYVALINGSLAYPILVQEASGSPLSGRFYCATTQSVNPPSRGPPGLL